MNTDELIHMLAKDAGPAPTNLAPKLLGINAVSGLIFASLMSILLLGLIPSSHLEFVGVWFKFVYALALTSVAAWALIALGKPGVNASVKLNGLLAIGVAVAAIGCAAWLSTPADERMNAVMGHSWIVCPWIIAGLSLPVLGLCFYAMRHMAPTHLRLTGAVCGLFAGAIAAAGYAFACTETAVPFVSVWYSLGILIAGGMGALLGPKFLNW